MLFFEIDKKKKNLSDLRANVIFKGFLKTQIFDIRNKSSGQ